MAKYGKQVAGAVSTAGAWLLYLVGGWDAALGALFLLMGLDYVTGLLGAFAGRSGKTPGGHFSSRTAFIGLSKKLMVMLIIALAATLDRLTGDGGVCRSAAIGFYAVNEGLSIMENAATLGVPLPLAMRRALESIQSGGADDAKAEE